MAQWLERLAVVKQKTRVEIPYGIAVKSDKPNVQ